MLLEVTMTPAEGVVDVVAGVELAVEPYPLRIERTIGNVEIENSSALATKATLTGAVEEEEVVGMAADMAAITIATTIEIVDGEVAVALEDLHLGRLVMEDLLVVGHHLPLVSVAHLIMVARRL